MRRERIYGEDLIDDIDDKPNEAIVPRLIKLLLYLDKTYPAEGWGRYLDAGDVNWGAVVVTGPWDSYGPNSFGL